MRCGGKKLLAGALALFAAVNLGRLAAELSDRGKLAQRLDQAIEAEKSAADELTEAMDAMARPGEIDRRLRRQGFVSQGDQVFFDGG